MNKLGFFLILCTIAFFTTFFVFEYTLKDTISSNLAYYEADSITLSSQISGDITATFHLPTDVVQQGQLLVTIDDLAWRKSHLLLVNENKLLRSEKQNLHDKLVLLTSSLSMISNQLPDSDSMLEKSFFFVNKIEKASINGGSNALDSHDALMSYAEIKRQHTAIVMDKQNIEENILNTNAALLINHDKMQNNEALIALSTESKKLYNIASPVTGTVSRLLKHTGDTLSVATPIMQIIPEGKSYIIAYIEESDAGKLTPNDNVIVTFDAHPEPYKGVIAYISPTGGADLLESTPNYTSGHISRIAQRIPVKINIDPNQHPTQSLAIGMSALIEVKFQ